MKLQPDRASVPTITAHGPGWLAVDGQPLTHSLLIGSMGLQQAWSPASFDALQAADFARLADWDTQLVIFGSGQRQRFVPAAWLAPLMARRIGLETMDTAAACRTYNVLVGEGRKVIAALLVEQPAPTRSA